MAGEISDDERQVLEDFRDRIRREFIDELEAAPMPLIARTDESTILIEFIERLQPLETKQIERVIKTISVFFGAFVLERPPK